MKTKPKTFDAVAASRKWREDTGRMLDTMTMSERIAYLEGLRNRGGAGASVVVRDDVPVYGAKSANPKPGG